VTGLFKRGKPPGDPPGDRDETAGEQRVQSKVLPRFLSAIARRPSPVLVDLGPVVGANIAFFGDRLACKIHVEDVCAEIEAHAKRGDGSAMGHALVGRLKYPPDSIDGVLCWNIFDFLDRKTSLALAARLVQMLRSGGALHGCFGTTAIDLQHYTRYLVDSEQSLRARPYAATGKRREVLTTRDINRMFEGLAIDESVLLKSSSREMLFRKL